VKDSNPTTQPTTKPWSLLIALVLGAVAGLLLHDQKDLAELIWINTNVLSPIGQIFLRMIFMIVVPLLFSALVLGVLELGGSRGLGKVASKTLLLTLVASSLSVVIGISLVNIFKPGQGLQVDQAVVMENSATVSKIKENADKTKSIPEIITGLVPKNPLDSAVRALDGEIIAFMVFALFFGWALSLLQQQNMGQTTVHLLQDLMQICMHIVELAMKLAPLAVFALVFNSTFKFGLDIFQSLLFYVAIVVVGLLIQQFVVYSALLKFVAKRSPIEFFKKCREVYLYAFSTASSNATLPKSLHTAEHDLKISKRISRFVLTVGSTANQNGTALFEGVTVLFLAQVYGIDLTLGAQVTVVLISILAGVGTAGIPGGSLPPMMILLQTVGIPAEGIGLIIGVDRFLDMARTTINVSGDLVLAACVDQSEST
jgi:DAACS family dicarboxylate/amino acid:cation (Na+ or H+) symporter